MIHPRKPVWTEGLFMTPQHLQQSDQYHEALLHARMHAVATYDWGITGVQFDERALTAGQHPSCSSATASSPTARRSSSAIAART